MQLKVGQQSVRQDEMGDTENLLKLLPIKAITHVILDMRDKSNFIFDSSRCCKTMRALPTYAGIGPKILKFWEWN